LKIALLGSIPKGDDVRAEWTDWKIAYKQAIRKQIPEATFIDGDSISDNAGPVLVVGHDLAMVKAADLCVVDAARKIGAGTAQEMMFAKYLGKPVVTVIPKDSHHRKSNITFHGVTMEEWIHPFLALSSDHVAKSIEDAARWIADGSRHAAPKDMSVYLQAIEAYQQANLRA
jgi:hypothetical protein